MSRGPGSVVESASNFLSREETVSAAGGAHRPGHGVAAGGAVGAGDPGLGAGRGVLSHRRVIGGSGAHTGSKAGIKMWRPSGLMSSDHERSRPLPGPSYRAAHTSDLPSASYAFVT